MPKRLQALVHDLTAAIEGDAKALHRSRVASRRVREALPIVGKALTPDALRKAQRRARALTRALGSVRELDVAMDVLSQRPADTATRRMAVERVRAQMAQERSVRRTDMQHQLHAINPNELVRKLTGAADEGAVPADRRVVLGWRLQSRADRLTSAVEQVGSIYLSDRLHLARIAVKKLRYALEIAGEYRAGATAKAVHALKDIQETLGRLHDLEVLNAHIQRAQVLVGTSDATLAQEFASLVGDAENECRTLHAKFLLDRPRLQAIADQATALGRRLTAPAPRTRSTANAASARLALADAGPPAGRTS